MDNTSNGGVLGALLKLSDSKEKLIELQEELKHVQRFVELVSELFGTQTGVKPKTPINPQMEELLNDPTLNMKDGRSKNIIKILMKYNIPMKAKEIKAAYLKKYGNDTYGKVGIGKTIGQSLAYLKRIEILDQKVSGEYCLLQKGD